ncbi:MAG: tyrosine-type recombinase/integrase [Candidatus Bathyarchaeia archaeon]
MSCLACLDDADLRDFLSVLRVSSRNVYGRGLKLFEQFYAGQGSLRDFLDRVERDRLLPRRERRRIAMEVLNAFVVWLQSRGYAPKTVRVYVGAVQSLAKYYNIPMSLRYVRLPPAQPVYKKHPWTLAEISEFIAAMDKPMYRSIAASILQSGLSLSDLLTLTYGDIKEELEKGTTPLCLDLTRKKTGVQFMTFLGTWAVKLLKEHLANQKPENTSPIYNVTARTVHAYFRKTAQKYAGAFEGRNPYSPHSLRAAFRTFLSDHKVDPLYIEYWMGHKLPEQLRAYINKSRESWRQTYQQQAEPWLTPPQYKTTFSCN